MVITLSPIPEKDKIDKTQKSGELAAMYSCNIEFLVKNSYKLLKKRIWVLCQWVKESLRTWLSDHHIFVGPTGIPNQIPG